MQQFIAYPTDFPVAAALAVVAAARGTSTLTLNEKVNAVEAVQMYAAGQALPITATPPRPAASPPKAVTYMSRQEFVDTLDAHCQRSDSERAGVLGSINWAAIVAAAIAFVQALIAAGV